jgi:hypothetical protein
MSQYIVSCVMFLMLTLSVYARVGENLAQCTARYGKAIGPVPIGEGRVLATFKRTEEPKTVTCVFSERTGVCVQTMYTRSDRDFTQDEMFSICQLYTSGTLDGWEIATPVVEGTAEWLCKSKALSVLHVLAKSVIMVSDTKFLTEQLSPMKGL